MSDAGFDHTVLSEFRARLVTGQAANLLLEALLRRAEALGLLRVRGRQRTDSTHVLAAVRVLNRLERVGERLPAALNSLAVLATDWLRTIVPPEWYERYGDRMEHYNLPKSEAGRREYAALIAADGQYLLQMIDRVRSPEVLTAHVRHGPQAALDYMRCGASIPDRLSACLSTCALRWHRASRLRRWSPSACKTRHCS